MATVWNKATRCYEQNGAEVDPATIRRAISSQASRSAERIGEFANKYISNQINRAEFIIQMREELSSAHLASATIAYGGKNQMGSRELGRVGQRIKSELEYLRKFERALANDKAGTPAQIVARAKSYANAQSITYRLSEKAREKDSGITRVRWVVNEDVENCKGCQAAEGIYDIDSVPALGSHECLNNCYCEYEFLSNAKSLKGGIGSGNFHHSGRLGKVGGSSNSISEKESQVHSWTERSERANQRVDQGKYSYTDSQLEEDGLSAGSIDDELGHQERELEEIKLKESNNLISREDFRSDKESLSNNPISITKVGDKNFFLMIFDKSHSSEFYKQAEDKLGNISSAKIPKGFDIENLIGFAGMLFQKSYSQSGSGHLIPSHIEVHKDYRRKGFASKMYDKAEELSGLRIKRSPFQSDDAKKFWESRKSSFALS